MSCNGDSYNLDVQVDTITLKPGVNIFGNLDPYKNGLPMDFSNKIVDAISYNQDIKDTSIVDSDHYLETSGNVVDNMEEAVWKARRYNKKNVVLMFTIDRSIQSKETMRRIKRRITTEYASMAKQYGDLKIYITFTTNNKELVEESDNDVIDVSMLSDQIDVKLQ